jgi:hypothetical protein
MNGALLILLTFPVFWPAEVFAQAPVSEPNSPPVPLPEQIGTAGRSSSRWPKICHLPVAGGSQGNGKWTDFEQLAVEPNQGLSYLFPKQYSGTWLRMVADRDCEATAYLHLTSTRLPDGCSTGNAGLRSV